MTIKNLWGRAGRVSSLFFALTTVVVGGCAGTKGNSSDWPCGYKAGDSKPFTYYGEKLKLAADKTVCIKEALANPGAYDGKFQVQCCLGRFCLLFPAILLFQ